MVFFLLSFSDLSHHRTCGSAYGGSLSYVQSFPPHGRDADVSGRNGHLRHHEDYGHSTPMMLNKYIKADQLEEVEKITDKYDYSD